MCNHKHLQVRPKYVKKKMCNENEVINLFCFSYITSLKPKNYGRILQQRYLEIKTEEVTHFHLLLATRSMAFERNFGKCAIVSLWRSLNNTETEYLEVEQT